MEIVSIFVINNTDMPQDVKPIQVYNSSKGYTKDEFESIVKEAFLLHKEKPIVVENSVIHSLNFGQIKKRKIDAKPIIVKGILNYLNELNDSKDPRTGKILSHLNRREYVKFNRKLKRINENKKA